MKNRVAIIGSDLSRELFDKSKPNFEVVLYRKNLSLISLMAKAVDYNFNQLDKEISFEKAEQILDELDKETLCSLIATQPDILLLDFYSDIFHGVVETQDQSFLTNSFQNIAEVYSFSHIKIKRVLNSNHSIQEFINYSSLWCKALNLFIEFVQKYLPKTVILINTVEFSKETSFKSNMSQVWQRFNEYAQKKGISIVSHGLAEVSQYLREEKGEISEASLKYNLIRNASFSEGKTYWRDDSNEYFVENGILEIERTSMDGFSILHSSPIQISNSEQRVQKFEISMEVWVENLFSLHLNDAFFYVWTYDDKVSRELQEVKIYSSKLENLSSGKWKHIKIELYCKGRYLELGPHMVGAGHFRYRNLSLTLKK
ncbi:DUF6270 domain-containing protein [Lactococcus lactis]|uniref:DUF6270 domain-containing protein n=1 Tax=Lactococcus lactis TaxID=1358 RepID=UPI0011237756|nr:DUF6270 domain-containing protein [Lactococcus lactis]TNU80944.1 hypothetical protein FIB48_01080 [Lactococcus lactis subsp. lactis]